MGEAMRQARKAKGWTQGQLSAQTGVPQSVISAVENGTRNAEFATICRLASALDLRIELRPIDEVAAPTGEAA